MFVKNIKTLKKSTVKEITSPKNDKKWILIEEGVKIEEEHKVAKIFNDFFIKKISDLKDNIDQSKVEDPTQKLEDKMKNHKLFLIKKSYSENGWKGH